MAVLKGIDGRVYHNAASGQTPTWNLVKPVIEVTLNQSVSTIDASNRGSVYRLNLASLQEISVDMQIHKDHSDTEFSALETAAAAGSIIDLMFLDGDKSHADSKGFRLKGFFSTWNESQGLEDAIVIDATFVPAAVADAVAPATGTAAP